MKKLKRGDVYTHSFSLSQQDVINFAEVTGDTNPIHLDADYAAQTIFKQPIVHGFLSASVFSKILGTVFPGEGSVYLSQNMQFLRGMFVDKPYEVVFTVLKIDERRGKAWISTTVIDVANRKKTIDGEAVVLNKEACS